MSDYSYLNDAEELTYGLELAQERFEIAAESLPSVATILQRWGNAIETLGFRACVASFSLDGDSLSQWRAYGPIAVGFKLQSLMFGYANTVSSRPVIYDPVVQRQLLDLMAHLCASAYSEDRKNEPDKVDMLYQDGTDRLLDVTAFFKHPAFADEREFRIVHVESPAMLQSPSYKQAPHRFRQSGGVLVPYVTTRDLAENHYPDKIPLEKVVIGPSPHAEVLQRGVEELLSTHGYDTVQVRRSTAPLRS